MTWQVEEGIGEQRAVSIENGRVVAARLHWPGSLGAGAVIEARLVHRSKGSARGTAITSNGREVLLDRLPKEASRGSIVNVAITRSAIAERGRTKRAQGRITGDTPTPAPSLAEQLRMSGYDPRIVHRFDGDADWEALFSAAWRGQVDYDGGTLLVAETPGMSVIDVDGPATAANARAAAKAVGEAVRLFDMGGSIGVDFPSLPAKPDRRIVDDTLAEGLNGWPHERTAMNGFGFVQIVARLERPSLFQRIYHARVAAAARLLLRRGEHLDGPGLTLLTCHPALRAHLRADWLEELSRRTGRAHRIETDPGLGIESGQAQIVTV